MERGLSFEVGEEPSLERLIFLEESFELETTRGNFLFWENKVRGDCSGVLGRGRFTD